MSTPVFEQFVARTLESCLFISVFKALATPGVTLPELRSAIEHALGAMIARYAATIQATEGIEPSTTYTQLGMLIGNADGCEPGLTQNELEMMLLADRGEDDLLREKIRENAEEAGISLEFLDSSPTIH